MKKGVSRRNFLKMSGTAVAAAFALQACGGMRVGEYALGDRRLPVLMYHDISLSRDDYTITPSLFAAHMEFLYSNGYRAVSFSEAESLPDAELRRAVIITFDDGYASFIDFAYSYLEQYGFKATINIIGEKVGSYIELNTGRPMLSWEEYRYLSRGGLVSFGCHMYHLHNFLKNATTVSSSELAKDLKLFLSTLKKETGKGTDILAWPFGFYNSKTIGVAKAHGFKYIMNSNRGYYEARRGGTGSDGAPRYNLNQNTGLVRYARILGI